MLANFTKTLRSFSYILVLAAVVFSVAGLRPAFAAESSDRTLFLELERLARSGKLDHNDPRLTQLQNYPLLPYIEYRVLAASGADLTPEQVSAFASHYPDLHLEGLLRYQLTQRLADQKRWAEFIPVYKTLENPNAEMQCQYTQALFSVGQQKQAEQLSAQLWQQGHSQPDACDPSFEKLFQNKQITSERALNRTLNALDEGNAGLAKYARRFVDDAKHQKIADRALKIYQSPDLIVSISESPGALKPYLARLQHMALNRAYRKSAYNAFEILKLLGDSLEHTPENLNLVARTGVRVAKDLKPEVESELALIDPKFAVPELTEWRIRLALYDQNWTHAHALIDQLPKTVQTEDRWQYWRAVVEARLEQRLPEFDALTAQRSFYGFLAAELTDQRFQLNQQSPRFTDALYAQLANTPWMARIMELVALDRYTVARSEWNQWKQKLNAQERQAAAHLMRDLNWYQQGILTAAYEGLWNDLQLRFPTVYFDHFTEQASARNIDPLWALAISRQESALFPWARSSAGARGLMQLMPKTAKQTARSAGVRYKGANSLYDPVLNIQLGTTYLSKMYEQFNGNRAYASAAYNAGPHRVKRWLEDNGAKLPLDIWIETIPFDETRTYVQNVLSFTLIYGELNQQPTQLLNPTERSQLRVAMR